jgi:hypothetical protein
VGANKAALSLIVLQTRDRVDSDILTSHPSG